MFHQVNNFHLKDHEYLFFDIFVEKERIVFVSMHYATNIIKHGEIELILNGNNKVYKINKHFEKTSYESSFIGIYEYPEISECIRNNDIINFIIKYDSKEKEFTLKTKAPQDLGIVSTTLFKDDWYLLKCWTEYYSSKGVNTFILYYNGVIFDELKEYVLSLNKNIILIEWNYKYWVDVKPCFNQQFSRNWHHAQLGMLNTCIYKYRNACDLLCMFDLDEYLQINTINAPELKNKNTRFFCQWSLLKNNRIPTKDEYFPPFDEINEGKKELHGHSKLIINPKIINVLGVHDIYNATQGIQKTNNFFWHFVNFSNPGRINI